MLSQEKITEIKVLVTSKPISIIKKNLNNNIYLNNDINIMNITNTLGDKINQDKIDNTYKLDTICFDPTNSSPPDEWCMRLKNRIRNYDSSSYEYINYLLSNK